MNRPARVAAWLSISSLTGVVPHVMEDLRYGQARNFHLTTVQFEWFTGLVVLATAAVAMASLAGFRAGTVGVLLIGLLWAGIGAADHFKAFIPGAFREGLASRIWVWVLVGLQGAAAIAAIAALRWQSRPTPRPE